MAQFNLLKEAKAPAVGTRHVAIESDGYADKVSLGRSDASFTQDSVIDSQESSTTPEGPGTGIDKLDDGHDSVVTSLQGPSQTAHDEAANQTPSAMAETLEEPVDVECDRCKDPIPASQVFFRCIPYGLQDTKTHGASIYAVCVDCQPETKTCREHGKVLVKSERMGSFFRIFIDESEESTDSSIIKALKGRDLRRLESLSAVAGLVNNQDSNKHTPLHVACHLGYEEEAKCLIAKGADLESRNIQSRTPLDTAVIAKNIPLIKLLLENGADRAACNGFLETPLATACRVGSLECVETLLDGCPVDQLDTYVNQQSVQGRSALLAASIKGRVAIVRRLLEAGANADITAIGSDGNMYPGTFMLPSSSAGIEILRLLANSGANLFDGDSDGWNHVHSNARHGRADMCREILDLSLKADSSNTPAAAATAVDQTGDDQKSSLPKAKFDPNAKTQSGLTAIFLAARYGHADVVRCLLEFGVNANIVCNAKEGMDMANRGEYTPLGIASVLGHTEVVACLVKFGVSLDPPPLRPPPIWDACSEGHLEVCRLLFDAGADMKASFGGVNLLAAATDGGNLELVRLMLSKGARASASLRMALGVSLRLNSKVSADARREIMNLMKAHK
jgi:ankyrin repeat protein